MKGRFFITQYAAIVRNKRILLLRNAERGKAHGKWVYPGGHIDSGEKDVQKSLGRELREELGMTLKKAQVLFTAIKKYPNGYRLVVYYMVQAAGTLKLSKEHDEFRWISLKDLKALPMRDLAEKKVTEAILRDA